jgi:MFS family permease
LITHHPLIQLLRGLRGNPRAVILTEFMFGIPYNLFMPYASVYMLKLGLTDEQIGLTVSVGLAAQMLCALLGGPVTDKLGRRKATLIFDMLAWSVPTFLWAIAQDFRFFIVAAISTGALRVAMTSWSCLLVEDADPDQLLGMYTWIYIASLVTGLIAPLSGWLVGAFSLIPTMRGLYLFAFVVLTIKILLLYRFSTETQQGLIRLKETRQQSLFSLFHGYGDIFRQVMRTPRTLFTLAIMLTMGLASTVSSTFWSILVTQKVQIPAELVALYPFARSFAMLIFFFAAMPVIKEMKFRNPMMVGFALLAVSQIILITLPVKSYALLLLSTLIEACSFAAVSTQIDRMFIVTVDAQERARIMGLLYLAVLAISTPFGWIAGRLSAINRDLPFLMNICLYLIGGVMVYLAARQHTKEDAAAEAAAATEAAEAVA